MVRDALYAPVAKERGLFRPDAVDALLADPNGRLTPLRGNELWQIALLELWLQQHGITGPRHDRRRPHRGPAPATEDHTEAITIGLHDASPPAPRRGDGRGRGARAGLGPADFRADLRRRGKAGRGTATGGARAARHLHLRARIPRRWSPESPTELFIDPSHTYRLRFTGDDQESPPDRPGITVRTAQRPDRCRRDEPGLRAVRHGARTGRRDLEQPRATCRRGELPGRGA